MIKFILLFGCVCLIALIILFLLVTYLISGNGYEYDYSNMKFLTLDDEELETVCRDVIKGKNGNNPERFMNLCDAGYDPYLVQEEVNKILCSYNKGEL